MTRTSHQPSLDVVGGRLQCCSSYSGRSHPERVCILSPVDQSLDRSQVRRLEDPLFYVHSDGLAEMTLG